MADTQIQTQSLVGRRDVDGIALLTLNNPPVNALSQALRQALLDEIGRAEADSAILGIVITGASGRFIAGADIREFDGPLLEPSLPTLLCMIEQSPKPVVAAVDGVALGGGAELALACHARCATTTSFFGFPEVNLGIIPGAGGIPRLIRLVDAEATVELVAGGLPISANAAFSAGLINMLVEKDRVIDTAITLARDNGNRPLSRTSQLPVRDFDQKNFDTSCARLRRRARGQASIVAAVDAVARSVELDFADADRFCREEFLRLRSSDQAAALRHLFFAERNASQMPGLDAGLARKPGHIAVIGAGTMGRGIATACLLARYPTILVDIDEKSLESAVLTIAANVQKSVKGLDAENDGRAILSGLSTARDYSAVEGCDLIIEAVFEDMSIKSMVLSALSKAAHPDALICTNTSYLNIDQLSEVVESPDRFIGLHFFAPAEIMKLVEVVRAERSQPAALATGVRFVRSLTKIPVLAGVCDGFIVNRILAAYRQEMEYLLEDGALPHEIDKALESFGMAMGPFAVADLSGLDIAWVRRKRLAPTRNPQQRYVKIADQLCELGRLGRKSGAGWYRYEDGKREPDPFVDELVSQASLQKGIVRKQILPAEIVERAIATMVAEAKAILEEGIALRSSDIDLAITKGLGFPAWRGGPLFYAQWHRIGSNTGV